MNSLNFRLPKMRISDKIENKAVVFPAAMFFLGVAFYAGPNQAAYRFNYLGVYLSGHFPCAGDIVFLCGPPFHQYDQRGERTGQPEFRQTDMYLNG
jgi:hypothetical protein